MADLTLGVVATSRKPDERRQAIHPAHLERIDAELRARMLFEHGYGDQLGSSDEEIGPLVGGLRSRAELFEQADVLLLPKPLAEDLETLRPGQVVWGWPHCVQDRRMAQLAIDRRVTLIAWEAMNHWNDRGDFVRHVFHQNNVMAGYCSVLHAFSLLGISGDYGRPLSAAVISFGSTARGASGRSRPSASARCRSSPSAPSRPSTRASPRCGCSSSAPTPRTRGARSPTDAARSRRWSTCWPSTTSSSTASCRTPTRR